MCPFLGDMWGSLWVGPTLAPALVFLEAAPDLGLNRILLPMETSQAPSCFISHCLPQSFP